MDSADAAMVIERVEKDGLALYFASHGLRADKEVVLAAVRNNGLELKFAASALRADKEVVLAAVAVCGFALEYAAKALKADTLLLRLAELPNRGRRNLHVFKVKFAHRAVVAYWSKVSGKDDAHFDDEGEAVMQGSGARAAKRAFDDMTTM